MAEDFAGWPVHSARSSGTHSKQFCWNDARSCYSPQDFPTGNYVSGASLLSLDLFSGSCADITSVPPSVGRLQSPKLFERLPVQAEAASPIVDRNKGTAAHWLQKLPPVRSPHSAKSGMVFAGPSLSSNVAADLGVLCTTWFGPVSDSGADPAPFSGVGKDEGSGSFDPACPLTAHAHAASSVHYDALPPAPSGRSTPVVPLEWSSDDCRTHPLVQEKLQATRSASLENSGCQDSPTDGTRRRGKGGRQPAINPFLDPAVDPKRAKRVLANRLSAARSKARQRSLLQNLLETYEQLCQKKEMSEEHKQKLMLMCSELEQANQQFEKAIAAIEHKVAYHKQQQKLNSMPVHQSPADDACLGSYAAFSSPAAPWVTHNRSMVLC